MVPRPMARTLSLPSKSKKTAAKITLKTVVRPAVPKAAAKKIAKPLKKSPAKVVTKKPIAAKPLKTKAAPPAKLVATTASNADFSKSPFNSSLKPAQKVGFLREMLRIRRFEQQALT